MFDNKKLNRVWGVGKVLAKAAAIGSGLFAFAGTAFAAAAPYVAVATISKSVDSTVSQMGTIFTDVALIAGIGFVIAAFFKFHQHKQNPQQVQMSQGISLLLIGAGLTLIPLLVPTASVSVLGAQGANNAKVGGSAIHGLIGSGT